MTNNIIVTWNNPTTPSVDAKAELLDKIDTAFTEAGITDADVSITVD